MSKALYFLEGAQRPADVRDDSLGLRYAFDATDRFATQFVAVGPVEGAAGGLLFAQVDPTDPAAMAAFKLQPDSQTWARMADCGGPDNGARIWFGFDAADPPGPEDLARPEPVGGYFIPLADGRPWLVPTARLFPEGTELPESLAIGPEGKLIRRPLPAFRELCRDADRVWAAAVGQAEGDADAPGIDDDVDGFRIAAAAMAVNYRVSLAEVSALGLLTTANLPRVLQAFVDFPEYAKVELARRAAAQKKTPADTPDGDASASGPPAS